MKITKYMSLSLISLMALGAVATTSTGAVDAAVAKTDADVTFVADDGETDPTKPPVVDPTDPDEPGKEVDPNSPGSSGDGKANFNINWVSDFNFGAITIGGQTMRTYASPTHLEYIDEAVPATTGLANFLQVTDNRGTNTGWNVTAEATPFYKLDTENEPTTTELTGAQLLLKDSNVFSSSDNTALSPTILSEGTDILTAGAHPILSADQNNGQGTWSLTWGGQANNPGLLEVDVSGKATAGVELAIPVSAKPEANAVYRSAMTWTLADTPTK